MKIKSFTIENFKGIKQTEVEVVTTAPGNVITLIGLNESGKTTILEAISNFVSADKETSSIVQTVSIQQRPVDLIPKSQESNFTGSTSIRALISLDQEDILDFAAHMKREHNITLDGTSLNRIISVRRVYDFIDSVPEPVQHLWYFDLYYRKGKGKNLHRVSLKTDSKIWDAAVAFLERKFPKIVYFPTFLFNVPDKIYLEDFSELKTDEQAYITNKYFRQVMQDVADSIGSDIDLEKHIVDRVKRHRGAVANPLQFLAYFMGQDEASQVRSIANKLAGRIGRVVFGAWNEISGRNVSGKSVRIAFSTDADHGNIPYFQLMIHDGEDDYNIHERSLGFRWFFTFLMFTHFRASRRSEHSTIFLFDEPAANLHAVAQTKLLESFGRIATGNKYIIYSTHSHYMINPNWLEKAYIIQNAAVNFENIDDELLEIKKTDIKATRYRHFVSQNPTRVSYFQPALDALRFNYGPLAPTKRVVVVEGKFDFHPLRYFQRRFSQSEFMVIPAPSASEVSTLISLLRGFGSNFVILLDDDGAGTSAAKKYKNTHLLDENQLVTIGEILPHCKGKPFESMFGDDLEKLVIKSGFSSADKSSFSLFFQNALIAEDFDLPLGDAAERARDLIKKLEEKIARQPKQS